MKLKYKLLVLAVLFFALFGIAFCLQEEETEDISYNIEETTGNELEVSNSEFQNVDNVKFAQNEEKKEEPKSVVAINNSDKSVKERLYNFSLLELLKTEFPVSEGLFRYSLNKNRLFLADQNHQIWQVNLDNLRSEKLAETGDAPNQNQNISSVLFHDDELFIVDIDKRSFRRQDLDGNVQKQDLKLNYITYNGIYLNKDYGISVRDDKSNSAFEIFNFSTSKIEIEYNLVDLFQLTRDLEFAEIITEGFFVGGFNLGTAYIPGRFGEFIMFDSIGRIKYKAKTIDRTEKPRVTRKKVFGNSYMYIREPDWYVNYSASLNRDYLIILSLDGEKSTHNNIDIYSVEDGLYLGSAMLKKFSEERPIEIMITEENNIWVLFENYTFLKYKLSTHEK